MANMTVRQSNHGTIQKVCDLHIDIFHPIHLGYSLWILLFTTPVLFTKNNKLWTKRKRIFFVYMDDSAYRVLSKEVDNRIFRPNRILGTCIYKQPYWQSSEIIIIFVQLSHSYLRYTDVLGCVFFAVWCNIIRVSWET